MSVTFDEFQAINRRENKQQVGEGDGLKQRIKTDGKARSSSSVISGNNKAKTTTNKVDAQDGKAATASSSIKTFIGSFFDGVGSFLEMHQMQAFYVFLLLVDLVCALLHLYLINSAESPPEEPSVFILNKTFASKLTEMCLTFTTFFFVIEMTCVLVTFKFAILGHFGYILDIATIAGQVYLESEGHGMEVHVLCFFRFWRLMRLFNSLLAIEKEANDQIIAKLDATDEALRKAIFERDNFETAVEKEKEARDAVESMLTSYKEEVDTLNEALKIAAMDIAEVAEADDDLLQSEDGDLHSLSARGGREDGDDDDDDVFEDAIGSKYSKSANKEVLLRAVIDDARQQQSSSRGGGAGVSAVAGSTFLVHEDGTFETK